MKNFSNLPRQDRIDQVMKQRRFDLCLILENLVEGLNISAILRTAESFGVGLVCIIYPEGDKPKLSNNISSGAKKWLKIEYFTQTSDCLDFVKDQGYKIIAAVVNPEAQNLWSQNFKDQKVAIMVGNEPKGLSEEAIQKSDKQVYLPMFGLTESLNVSVAAALFLYEVVRQKELANP